MLATKYVQAEKFSGRVLVTFENGEIVREQAVRSDEHLATLEGFIETARMAGFTVIPPAAVSE
ncbi:hypothetical protein NTH60_004846 [Enterobacter ludwigii]|nr:hypothetical protein [Enterobacter ludwigii]EKS6740788.1 hypothetical protein [Enterobacter ludwigii]